MNAKARSIATTARLPRFKLWLAFAVLAVGAAVAALRPAAAQEAPATLELATADELYDLVGPIALYPDDLVAIVLPASTYPLQVVQAARFLEDRKRDSSLQPDEEWDDSIIALLNYPEVVELMNDDLDWTYDLGTAVLNQRADVLNAIQDFRDEAYAAGNLRSDDRLTVAREDDDTIVIKPADPQVIYVPYYEPREVVVYQPVPVFHYYPHRYAVYYYPYPAHYTFDLGFFWGVRSWYSIGWHTHHVHLYDWHYHGHPYYGWRYYDPFYVHNVFVNVNVNRNHDHIWQPRHRYGGRPVVRGSEGRVYTTDRAPRRGVLDANAAAARSREGSVYRTQQGATRVQPGAATSARSTQVQPRRGVPSSSYRDRAAQTTERATAAAQARAPSATGSAQAQGRERPTASQGTYRRGGGMSQALERNRAIAQPSREVRSNAAAVSPRAVQRSTGMPREAARSAPAPRASAPVSRAPSHGAGVGAQRSESGGASRGNSGGGSYRSGGGSTRGAHPAARGSAGR